MKVDYALAKNIFHKIIDNSKKVVRVENEEELKLLAYGRNKTFLYIAVTQLLAKATNEKIDCMSLQVSNGSVGSFNARTLCHKVVVPVEREKIWGIFGNSMEPYCSKPARYKNVLDIKSKHELEHAALVSTLSCIKDSVSAEEKLIKFIALRMSMEQKPKLKRNAPKSDCLLKKIYTFAEKCCGGESLTSLIGTLETLWAKDYPNIDVNIHHVNQSGNSNKQFSDIDVHTENVPLRGIESKDRNYSKDDVTHFAENLHAKKCEEGLFIYGLNATGYKEDVFVENTTVRVIGFKEYVQLRLSDNKITKKTSQKEFNEILNNVLLDMNASTKCMTNYMESFAVITQLSSKV
jgi:hypothetical protein